MSLLLAFLAGMREFRASMTRHYPADAELIAYDRGRDLAHRITLRRFEP